MYQANIHDAKTNLSALIQRALNGEQVIIAKNGVPQVELKPATTHQKKSGRKVKNALFGCMKGKIHLLPGFDEPLMDWEAWSKESIFPPEKK